LQYLLKRCAYLILAAALIPVCEAAPLNTTTAPAATTQRAADSVHLGNVKVTGARQLVQTLQQIKVALNKPVSFDHKHVDDMVCMLHAGHQDSIFNRTSAVLECGSAGWFVMRLNAQRGAMDERYYGSDPESRAAITTLGHPWHIERVLSYRQLAALRKLLKKLPAPGKGQVKIVGEPNNP
jgi:hypothetical protein